MDGVIVSLLITTVIIFILKWVGAWMLGVTNVMDKQDKTLKKLSEAVNELKTLNNKIK